MLLVGALLAASILVALASARVGFPAIGPSWRSGCCWARTGRAGIEFDDAELARTVGTLGLAAILFEGGPSTSWRRLRTVAVPAALLSTVGVVVTMAVTGIAAHLLFDLTLRPDVEDVFERWRRRV